MDHVISWGYLVLGYFGGGYLVEPLCLSEPLSSPLPSEPRRRAEPAFCASAQQSTRHRTGGAAATLRLLRPVRRRRGRGKSRSDLGRDQSERPEDGLREK